MTDTSTATSAARRLATLAVLRAHWSEGQQSYVDTFLPFALEAIRLEDRDEVPLGDIQARMLSEFGIELPTAALDKLLRGAARNGQGSLHAGSFQPERAALLAFDTAAARQTAHREQSSLIQRLIHLAAEQEIEWTADDAADAMANYLDRHATSLLATSHGQDLGGADAEADDGATPGDFVVASLFGTVLDQEPEAARYVEHLVVGTMLSSALYTPDLDRISDPLSCDVYLDTPTLIDALGHGGTVLARAARESIVLLQEAGATIKCFDHTAVEMERKLCDVAQQLRDRRHRSTSMDAIIVNAVSRKLSAEDLEQAAGRVRAELRRLKIDVIEAPPHAEKTTIDEGDAEKILVETLGHSRKSTIQFDLDSLTAIYTIRGGRPQYRIEACAAIFATPHGRLVGAARQIFPVRRRDVPVAIGLTDLVTLAWLKKPRAMPELPRLRIAADCYATVQPSPGLIRRYVDEAAKLRKAGTITEDDLYELRYGTESRRILMVRTKGRVSAVDAEAVRDVLEERNRQIAARARTAAERDANAVRVELAEERTGRQDDKAHFEKRIKGLEQETTLQGQRLAALQGASDRRRKRVRLMLSAAVVLSAIAGVAVPLASGAVDGSWPTTILIVAAAALACAALVPHVGHKRVWAGVGAAGLVLGIVLAIHELASDSSHHAPHSKAPPVTSTS